MTATRTRCLLSVQPVADGGGSETALIGMIAQLAAAGWECHVALPETPVLAAEYAAAGATLHVVPMARLTTSGGASRWVAYALGWPVAVVRLGLLARRVRAGLIHTNSLHSWYAWAAAAGLRLPHVWHAREIVVQSGPALRVERLLTRRFATRVVAVSAAVAVQLDSTNVVVVTDDPDPAFDPARAGTVRAGLGLADTDLVVGAASRLDTWKGVDVLLDAVPALRAAHPGVEVVVAGAVVPGKEAWAATLEARAAALGVHWLGPRRDMPALLADLDVAVQASTEPEPWGLVLVEALASGVPVVATAGGGPVEILDRAPAGSGRLVPFADSGALATAVADLLPVDGSSTDRRRARSRRWPAGGTAGTAFVTLFDALAG